MHTSSRRRKKGEHSVVFSSLLFVFLFFSANYVTQALMPDIRRKNIVMLVFSLVFYAWAGPRYLLLLLGMVGICWFTALRIGAAYGKSQKKLWMIVGVALVLIILGVFKYTGFLLGNLKALTGWPKVIPSITLPIGISFYSFQLLSYVVDVYRGEVEPQRKYWLLLLYASLFHQCIAGPIVRYQDVNEDILHRRVRNADLSAGITRFAVGLAKKAILANGCAAIADQLLLTDKAALSAVPAAGVWLGCLAYMLQIYLDFSAYSDMAIGMGLMCGFHYKENFNYPYVADSVTDFWRRWHISLSTFFRDYVYIPLGGNRKGTGRQVFNMFVVWALTGMWHGASWNYVLWGLYWFVFLLLEKYPLRHTLERTPAALRRVGVLLVVFFGWILFKFESMSLLGTALKGLFGGNGNGFTSLATGLLFKNNLWFLLFCCIAVTPLGKLLRNMLGNLGQRGTVFRWIDAVWNVACPVLLLVLSAMALAGDSYNPFLYFQF